MFNADGDVEEEETRNVDVDERLLLVVAVPVVPTPMRGLIRWLRDRELTAVLCEQEEKSRRRADESCRGTPGLLRKRKEEEGRGRKRLSFFDGEISF